MRLWVLVRLVLNGLAIVDGVIEDADFPEANVTCAGEPDEEEHFFRDVTGGMVNEAGTRIEGTWRYREQPGTTGTFVLTR